ncbi:bifunctional DNA primase/polymerase [Kitasatospora sp. NBC_01287]|uniref:bifunctional DNA primase/polymerase n=1 Tax=Kitasatospora sp. NBC_01287 TaxID=2903573 RepID=UPI002257715F|nr:bifunctional DNA primase/polymerase [Kitasatospora sp. NBC_01287]MCX4746575.1 bifunctional DNA primase/polymerase [Kitasatospora sp. NBC_01287]
MDNLFGDLRFGSRRRTRATAYQAAAEYAGRWGWTVALGSAPARTGPTTGLRPGDLCSCGRPRCAAPGLHPPHGTAARELPPGAAPHEARALWDGDPQASVLLPTGRGFDVLDVPEAAGLRALVRLERMGTQVGPVLASPAGRLLFFVARGTAEKLPDLLYRMGWDDAALDLGCHGEGAYLAAPPTVLPGLGPMRWLRHPCRESASRPPEARLLLGTIAYACHRGRERAVAAEPAWLAS